MRHHRQRKIHTRRSLITPIATLDAESARTMQINVAVSNFDDRARAHDRNILFASNDHMPFAGGEIHALVRSDAHIVALRLNDVLALMRNAFDAAVLRELADACSGVQGHALPSSQVLILLGHHVEMLAAGEYGVLRRAQRNAAWGADCK